MRCKLLGRAIVSIRPQPENAPLPTAVTPSETTSFLTSPRLSYHGASPDSKSAMSPVPDTVSTPAELISQRTFSPHEPSASADAGSSAQSIKSASTALSVCFFIKISL